MKRHAVYLLLMLLFSILYLINLSTLPLVATVERLFESLVSPIYQLKAYIRDRVEGMVKNYLALAQASKERDRLRKEVEELSLYKAQLATCERNLMELAKAVEFTQEVQRHRIIFASITAYDASGRDAFVIINMGRDAGIEEGFIVAYGKHLVGVVDRAYAGSSRVRTVYSEDFTISAEAGGRAYIYKGGFPTGNLLHVKVEDELRVGDRVFLRVKGKYLPMLDIGTVEGIKYEGKGFFKEVRVKPLADIRRAEILTVLKEKP